MVVLVVDEADGAAEIDGVPQDDRVDDEIEAGSAVGHRLGDAVAQFSELMKEYGPRQGMTAFALVENGVRSSAQLAACARTARGRCSARSRAGLSD